MAGSIDLNCDVGEIPSLIADGTDDRLLAQVTSANIARGVHAAAGGEILPRLVGLAGSGSLDVYRESGFTVAAEAFADRRYEPDGRLRSRALPGALLEDPDEAAAQAVSIARDGRVTASDGSSLAIAAGTLCLHGDTPGAVRIATAVRAALAAAGIAVAPLG